MFKKILISAIVAATAVISAFAPAQAAMAVPRPSAVVADDSATIQVRGGRGGGGFRGGGFRGHRGGFGGHRFGRRHWGHRPGHHHRPHRWKRWRHYGGYGVYVAGPGCGYYKARWYDTGSYHWKRKYYICRGWY